MTNAVGAYVAMSSGEPMMIDMDILNIYFML